MKVSIITVVYNNEDTIADAVNSVLNQDYNDIEYIIIDGQSNDGTLQVLKQYKDQFAEFVSETDNGIYDAMNKGLSYASGEVIGFLNADDFLITNNCISLIVKKFNKTKAEVVYGDNVYVNRTDVNKVVRYWSSGEYKKAKFKKGWMPPHPATYIKKDLYDEYGYFDADIKVIADYDLLLRFMYKHDAKASYLPKAITKMRIGGNSNGSFGLLIKKSEELRQVWKKNNLKIPPLITIRRPLGKIKQYFKISKLQKKTLTNGLKDLLKEF
jgi:glycosyltransferase involved in cell wall biosynthesis